MTTNYKKRKLHFPLLFGTILCVAVLALLVGCTTPPAEINANSGTDTPSDISSQITPTNEPFDFEAHFPHSIEDMNMLGSAQAHEMTDIIAANTLVYAPTGAEKFLWPVPDFDNIVIPFGWAFNNSFHHRGITIADAGIEGAPIVASKSGIVFYVGTTEEGSLGEMLFINHGDNTVTIYSPVQNVTVQPGDEVAAGQPIAEVALSPYYGTAALQFELWQNGVYTSPVDLTDAVE